ncbi:MAG TPA: pyridoxine 5'-phosphate synthase, partial [bacterium]|nr:pyridoxine 5'-phosphate synthase [bacterium]
MGGLGVNIDHIATLRQARRGRFPEPVFAAGICEIAGCDSIVCHLREDRRHIQDKDVYLLKSAVRRLNLEMAVNEGIVKIALDVCPAQVTLVPEKREELTTEGGLDVSGNLDRIKQTTDRFHEKGIVVSLFIDPDFKQIDASKSVGADAIEIHTGKYADIFEEHQESL